MRLSGRVFVVTGRQGLRVPGVAGPFQRVDLAALTMLAKLAGGVASLTDLVDAVRSSTPAPEARPPRLVAALEEAGALVPADEADGRDDRAAPSHDGPPPADDQVLVAEAPLAFTPTPAGFTLLGHDGEALLRLDAPELAALGHLCRPVTLASARADHRRANRRFGLSDDAFDALVGRLLAADVVHPVADPDAAVREGEELSEVLATQRAEGVDALVRATERRWAASREDADERISVIPVTFNDLRPPLGLGMIFAYAMALDRGRLCERYRFEPVWITSDAVIDDAGRRPSVFLFSNYLWSHAQCLEVSARAKELHPDSVCIHGGPNTPKYPGDVEDYFAAHPHVDITVRGEGEATTAAILDALVDQVGRGPVDLSVLADVAGLSYRDGDRVVHTEDRPRLATLDDIPSPYLNGLFDVFEEAPPQFAVIETNRGCPYGCTFCDWGSATASRIRKFDLQRAYDELEWCARNGVPMVNVADANFGIFARDVDIARKVVELNGRYGFPKAFAVNFAKNTAKHLRPIIEMMVEAGIFTTGVLSLQSMDPDTLSTIERSNIKIEKYEELAAQFRAAQLPIHVDIMMGLPGQSLASFGNDLQECIDREVAANIPPTQLLINSPMNEPSYRDEHGIEARPGGLVVSTATFTRADYARMETLRRTFLLFENFGVLRQVSRFVRQETGRREIDLYDQLLACTDAEPERWPTVAYTLRAVPRIMAPPGSWRPFVDELRDLLVVEAGAPDDDALDAVLAVQHALLPARRRRFPATLELPHDVAAWHAEMIRTKDAGHHHDWPDHVARLASFGPATFTVDDPDEITTFAMGQGVESYAFGLSWELRSPVARPTNFRRELVDSGVLTLTRAPQQTRS